MKAARLTAFGRAEDVLRVEEMPDPVPGPGEVLVRMLAAPINPADLNIIEGKYGELPALPAIIGNEGSGRIEAVGAGVSGLAAGDLVLPLNRACWAERMVAEAAAVVRLPAAMDPLQAAMLSVNPPSALGMIEDYVDLGPGDWIVQNAANSAVGRCVIQIARARGLRTLNLVRRASLFDELKEIGADAVALESEDLREAAPRLCGSSLPRLALNAVGGASALNLANALADGGTHVTYGAMGRQPLKIPNGLLIFRNLRFAGFWLRRMSEDRARREAALRELAELSVAGRLRMPVHRVFPLDDLPRALEAAAAESRSGKVLLSLGS